VKVRYPNLVSRGGTRISRWTGQRSFTPDFRWLVGRSDSPWYPSVRLFRQTETRDYVDVVEYVRAELLKAVEQAKDSGFACTTGVHP